MLQIVLNSVKLHKNLKKNKTVGKEGRNDRPICQVRKLKLSVGKSTAQSHTTGKKKKGGLNLRHFDAKFGVPSSAQCGGVEWDAGAKKRGGLQGKKRTLRWLWRGDQRGEKRG